MASPSRNASPAVRGVNQARTLLKNNNTKTTDVIAASGRRFREND
ncbi:hypothetical protein ECP030229310_5109 [Escherichia coli P0302293.10]|nr:hypothetical protein ECP030229310_5109 [Escherichia coli P0302293.10]